MLLVLLALIVFGFLLLGSVVFCGCIAMPFARAYALSVALWFAVFGCCVAGVVLLNAIFLLGGNVVVSQFGRSPDSKLSGVADHSSLFLSLGLVGAGAIASGVSWIHQKLIHRMTFALFRVYAAVVCAGMGSVFGWAGGFWLGSRGVGVGWIVFVAGMFFLAGSLGWLGWRSASSLRGSAPGGLTWITAEEFRGRGSDPSVG